VGSANDTTDQGIILNILASGSVMQIFFENLVANDQWWGMSMTSLNKRGPCQ
jgi:hypothetical protein